MSKTVAEAPVASLSEAMRAQVTHEFGKYPSERKRSAILMCLAIVQQEHGWVSPEHQKAIAEFLDIPPVAVSEAVTFYDMCNAQPKGRYRINICTNLPCQLRGALEAMAYLEQTLGIKDGGTTADGLFSIAHCECLGACADAPVMIVNDRDMCSFMSDEKLQQLIDGLKAAEVVS